MPGTVYTEDKLEYSFHPLKTFRLSFGVKAASDAHVALTSGASDSDPMTEIFIGGWSNAKSAIRFNKEKPDKVETETPAILSADEERMFVVEWTTAGKISVFMKGASEPFLSWTNESPYPITHFGLRTAWGATGEWKIDGAKDVHTEDSMDYTYFPVCGGSLTFEVRAKNDAHVVLAAGPSDETPTYEIFLGGWDNTKCALRRNKEKPNLAEAAEMTLCADEFKKFWIKWNYAGVEVGRGDEESFLNWANMEPSVVTHFGIRTGWGSDGYWHIEGVDGTASDPAAPETTTEGGKASVPTVDGVSWVAASGGQVPEGALVGGSENGEDMIVVRCEHEEAVIPGKLVSSHGVAYIPWGGAEHSKESYEVLVVPAEAVSWVAASGEKIPDKAIAGGLSLEGETLYIGRATHEGALTIGKVHPSHGVLYISYGGEEVGYPEYEILVKN